MTVEQFYTECGCESVLKVLSARTGKIFTPHYKQEKHAETVGKRELLAVWAELQVINSGFGNYCRPIVCCYISDRGTEDTPEPNDFCSYGERKGDVENE